MLEAVASVLAPFLLAGLIFSLIQRATPKERRIPLLRRGVLTDISYWTVAPLFLRPLVSLGAALITLPVAFLIYGRLDEQTIMQGHGPISEWPLIAQALLLLVVGDFTGYWTHRAFHGRRLWPVHAVHHSPTHLDWLSAARVHPLNGIVTDALTALPILVIGAAPIALAGVLPFLAIFAVLLHANVDWDWGPLRGVIASPRFHRWHHTLQEEGRDKNFAGLLPLWDILFGTYYMPKGARPEAFGADLPVPQNIFGQMIFPFQHWWRRGRSPKTT